MNESLHEAERQLYASEQRFAALALVSGQIIWTTLPDGSVVDMPLWRAFTGQRDDEVSGWGWLDAIHPDEQAHVRRRWESAVTTHHHFEMEWRVRHAAGDYRVLLTRAVPVFDEQGRLREWVGSSTDITAQKQLEQHARQALDAVLAMAEATVTPPDSVAVPAEAASSWLTIRGVAKRLAELTRHLLGCQRVGIAACDADLREYPLVAVGATPADEEQWMQHQGLALASRLPTAVLARLQGGEVVIMGDLPSADANRADRDTGDVLIAPVLIGAQLAGLVALDFAGAAHAYTPEEIALAQTVTRLLALVIERDRLVRERETAHAKVLALQELNQRMDEFLGIVSHELRTPLTAMKASIQLSERRIQSLLKVGDGLPDEYAKKLTQTYDMLERSDRQTNRLTRLIGELLDASRIHLGKIEFHIAPANLATIVRAAVDEQRLSWPNRVLSLTMPDDAAFMVAADAERIEQVVTNLLTNALKYTPAETPIVITLETEESSVKLSVRDDGPGIPLAEQSKIWERFYRLPGTQELNGGGVGFGLGLFICQTIVAQHGGAVGVISAPGDGATFWFTLPQMPA